MLIPALASATDPDKNADVAVTSSIAAKTRSVSLGVGKSVVVDLPREAKDVLVADPKIANAVIRSAQRAYIIGAAVGQTNVVFFDATATRSPPTTSRSSAISTACAPR